MIIFKRIFLYILTFPFAFIAIVIDTLNIFSKKENLIDQSYFLIYLDEIEEWIKE